MLKRDGVVEVISKVIDCTYKNNKKYYIAKSIIVFNSGKIFVEFGEGQTRRSVCQKAFDTAMSTLHIPARHLEGKVWFSD